MIRQRFPKQAAGFFVLLSVLFILAVVFSIFFNQKAEAQFGSAFWGEPTSLIYLGKRSRDVLPASTVRIDHGFKFGHNDSVGSAAFETVWSEGGFYVWPSTAETMSIASSDVDDTSAGNGARTVDVYGYDANLLELAPITLTLNGQTAVAIGTDLLRVFRLIVKTAGSSNGNEGTVYVGTGTFTAGVPATVYALIDSPSSTADGDEENQTHQAVWTCPSDAIKCLLTALVVECSSDCTFRMKLREFGGLWRSVFQGDILSGQADLFSALSPGILPAGADFEIQVESLTGGSIGAGAGYKYLIYR